MSWREKITVLWGIKRSQSHNGVSGPNPLWILAQVSTHGLSPSPRKRCKPLHVLVARALLGELIRAATATLQPSPAAFSRGKGRGELRLVVGLPGGSPARSPLGRCAV